MFSVFSVVYFLLPLVSTVLPSPWKAFKEMNPGCTKDCGEFNILHIGTHNESVSIHFLLAASELIYPSLLILSSSVSSASPVINWALINNISVLQPAITLPGITQSYAMSLVNLIEYNDLEDKVNISLIPSNPDRYKQHAFCEWNWKLKTPFNTTGRQPIEEGELFAVTFSGTEPNNSLFGTDGFVDLKFMFDLSGEHNPAMPRLQFVPGLNIQFELSLVNLFTKFDSGRFGLQLDLISQESVDPDQDYRQVSVFSINDETTPGIFEMINIKLDERVSHAKNVFIDPMDRVPLSTPAAYFQTRPVCYTSPEFREIKNSRNARLSRFREPLRKEDWDAHVRTLPRFFYRGRLGPSNSSFMHFSGPWVGIRRQNVTFGTPEDGFYNKSKSITWAASFGFGPAPSDNLSSLLVGLISLSAVVILGSILFGTMVILICRKRNLIQPVTAVNSGSFQRLVTEVDDPIDPRTVVST